VILFLLAGLDLNEERGRENVFSFPVAEEWKPRGFQTAMSEANEGCEIPARLTCSI
jgi:hypothetical protein